MVMKQDISRRAFVSGLGSTALLTTSLRSNANAASGAMGSQIAADADWQAGAPAEWERILKAAREEGQVTVAGFPSLAKPMGEALKRDTGITLNWFSGGSHEQSARFEAEARAKNMSIDILLGGGRELGAVMRDGLLNPVKPQLILPGVGPGNFRDGKHKWVDDSGEYLLQGSEWVFGWLLVNKDVIDPGEIRTWQDMLKPQYRGKIVSHDPRSPGPGQGASTFLLNVFGIEFIKAFFLGQETKLLTNTRQVVDDVVRGIKPIAFAAIQFDVESYRRAGIKQLEVVLPEDQPGYLTGGFSVLKQAKGVPHPNAATVFVNWYMSKPGQEVYQAVMLETSRRNDVDKSKIPTYLIPRERFNYFEEYNERVYHRRHELVTLITNTLGGR
jgi:ABC-type Fe3+ transport system substrate-binding protein